MITCVLDAGGYEPRPLERALGAFGEKLRKQREQRGIALDAISNTTKISTRMLRALEEEQFDQLPGGVFNKGFVRAYARQVGLDEEETVTDYLAALRESQIQAQTILPDFRTTNGHSSTAPPQGRPGNPQLADNRNDDNENGRTSLSAAERRKHNRRNEVRRNQDRNRPEAIADASRSPVVRDQVVRNQHARLPENGGADQGDYPRQHDSSSLPGFITVGSGAEGSTEPPRPRSPFFSRISLSLAAAFLLATAGLAVWNSHRHRESAAKLANASTSSSFPLPAQAAAATQTPAPSSQLASASHSVPPSAAKSVAAAPPPSTNASLTSAVPKPAANPPAANPHPDPAKPATNTAAAKPPATFTVLIRAEETTWVAITADGKPVAHETLIAPAHTSIRAAHEIVVRAGNAAGVSFLVNHKEIPASGNEGEVKTYVFDPNGISSSPQTEPPAANR